MNTYNNYILFKIAFAIRTCHFRLGNYDLHIKYCFEIIQREKTDRLMHTL